MKFIYAPGNGEPLPLDLDPEDLTTDEAEAIEGAGGTQWATYGHWVDLINGGGWRAWRVALWIMLRRSNPDLGFEEVKPKVRELLIEPPDADAEKAAEEDAEPGKSEPAESATDSP